MFNIKLSKGLAGTALFRGMSFVYSKSIGQENKKLGIALVGLGSYSSRQLAPGLQDAQHCYLAGIVTDTPKKATIWMEKYNIPKKNVYNYENFDAIAENPDIDIVYLVLPNSMHADFYIRAAKAGKYVICEKPMAVTVKECGAIIDAFRVAGVKLNVGYRMQSDPYTNEVKRLIKEKPFGKAQFVS